MKATMVSFIPANPAREKAEGLFFKEGRVSFKTEIIIYRSGILFLDGYDYLAKCDQQIELLAGCFEQGSNIEEVLRTANILKSWERLYGILMSIGNIPVLVSRYDNDPETIYQELQRQVNLKNQNII